MEYTIFDMIRTGTTMFADFREGGVVGVDALKEAMRNKGIDAKIFGRPLPGVEEGWTELLSNVHGIGISTTKDHDFRYLSDLASETQKKDNQFAIHAGEENRSDIEDAIELHPDHLVHMCAATKKDLRIIADKGIPVVVCPRSNFVTGVAPPGIGAMMEEGITVGVGTDNVMLNAANMFSECECISKLFLRDDVQALKICTMGGANVLKEDSIGSIEEGKRANIMVINDESYNMHGVKDPISGVVRRARADDVLATIHEGVLTWKQG
jgi:cytosine/adenosine deaminase-related metal-dependent hydrolase